MSARRSTAKRAKQERAAKRARRKRATTELASGRGARKRSWIGRVAKWLGIAGLVGVAAGGALIARDERQRRAYTPDEVRQRLHERAAQAGQTD
ncbi:MAG: hypothetical protein Q4G46_04005 [Propionibacteriaceae bacterium]|nr:hypothetical protein [Propionibacteriaceae bacterium]